MSLDSLWAILILVVPGYWLDQALTRRRFPQKQSEMAVLARALTFGLFFNLGYPDFVVGRDGKFPSVKSI